MDSGAKALRVVDSELAGIAVCPVENDSNEFGLRGDLEQIQANPEDHIGVAAMDTLDGLITVVTHCEVGVLSCSEADLTLYHGGYSRSSSVSG